MPYAMVVIPTYNESENLAGLVRSILALPAGIDVLVVDDGSPDGTGDIADQLAAETSRVHVLHRTKKEGIGPAYVAGFQYALRQGVERILQMDADLSHNPQDLPRLLAASENADLVLGSRYKGWVRVLDWSVRRLMLSLGASAYVKMILGMPIADPTGGFKCFRRRVLESIDLDHIASKGYSFQIEMNYRSWKKGFQVVEIPIVFTERLRGGSKITKNIIYEALYILWRIRFQAAYDRKYVRPEPLPVAAELSKTAASRE